MLELFIVDARIMMVLIELEAQAMEKTDMSELALSRRWFVGTSAAALSGMCAGWAQPSRRAQPWNLHVTEQPDLITAYCGDAQAVRQSMSRSGSQWGAACQDGRIELKFE